MYVKHAYLIGLLIVSAAISVPVLTAACDCGYGVQGSDAVPEEDFCDCQCNEGTEFVPPLCQHTESELVPLFCVINGSLRSFSSRLLEDEIRRRLNIQDVGVVNFRISEDNASTVSQRFPGKRVVRITVRGTFANQLILSVRDPAITWTRNLDRSGFGIYRVFPIPIVVGPTRQTSPKVADMGDFGDLEINAIEWLLGIVVLILFMCFSECICFQNTYDKVLTRMTEEGSVTVANGVIIINQCPPPVSAVGPGGGNGVVLEGDKSREPVSQEAIAADPNADVEEVPPGAVEASYSQAEHEMEEQQPPSPGLPVGEE